MMKKKFPWWHYVVLATSLLIVLYLLVFGVIFTFNPGAVATLPVRLAGLCMLSAGLLVSLSFALYLLIDNEP